MISITNGKGFHLTFKNGWTISIQIGPGNYCDNYNMSFFEKVDGYRSTDAEIAIWDKDRTWYKFDGTDESTCQVKGRVPAEEVYDWIEKVRRFT